ncbi:2-hydroxychromene-2-carboxylate isomerase [Pseudomonas sp.]|uniref:2-hydroxychromene-2-carboxylate isomerase n=1 Tax=Pseudomonas sp. TaxID=306 RepID=UPI002630E0C6|nr:2-hydroxychromene-2-carboxylate isomerase [Pseudomonas sp.]
MRMKVEFFFDVGSPASYLAWTQLPKICAAKGAELVFRPMLLGGIFQATGNVSPAAVPAKGRHSTIDLGRFARRYGVSLLMNPHFPINTLQLMRAVTGVQMRHPERFEPFLAELFNALWVEALNLNEPQLVGRTIIRAGFSVEEILALTNEPDVKAQLRSTTDDALERGVFGAPTLFVGDQMFFGQDRLDFVEEALS